MEKEISLGNIKISNKSPLILIAGPCQLESKEHAKMMAIELDKLTKKLGIGFVFKTSFDKANRTSINSKRGVGMDEAIKIFQEIKTDLNIPIITDIHEKEQCAPISEVVDILQIPAFLCRQTDLLVAAAKTGKIVNIKKGQFLSPNEISHSAEKVSSSGNEQILLTERGVSFGYNNLVVDMRSIVIMKRTGYPVIFDATHSVQLPGGSGCTSSGQREFALPLAKAAVSQGIAGVFIETHDEPEKALCDGSNMIHLKDMEQVIKTLQSFDKLAKSE